MNKKSTILKLEADLKILKGGPEGFHMGVPMTGTPLDPWQPLQLPIPELMISEYNNLCDYCERMKSSFWPDWEQCVTRQKVN